MTPKQRATIILENYVGARDLAEQIERAITEAVQAQREAAWQPIETAPTNVSVLVFMPRWEHYGPGIYRAILVDMGTGKRWHSTAWACGRDVPPDEWPTHWQPLPAPPAAIRGSHD
jgi:hypothetical protein